MVEIHFHLIVADGFDHSGQFGFALIRKRHHHSGFQCHITLEYTTTHDLDVIRVIGAKGALCFQHNGTFVTGFQAEYALLKPRQQVAIADGEAGRSTLFGGIHHGTIHQQHGKVQGYPLAGSDSLFAHCAFPGFRSISRIIMAAPTVMALSATLKAGK